MNSFTILVIDKLPWVTLQIESMQLHRYLISQLCKFQKLLCSRILVWVSRANEYGGPMQSPTLQEHLFTLNHSPLYKLYLLFKEGNL